MKKLIACLPALVIVLSCCGGASTEETTPEKDSIVCIMPAPNQLDEISWMVGTWENTADGISTTENWVKTNEELLTGESYSIELETGDTVFYESIEIRHESTGLVYSPVVKDQNDGAAIDFLLMLLNDSTVQFENTEHDFPQKIVYSRFGDDSISATVSGIYEGEAVMEVFPMKRVK